MVRRKHPFKSKQNEESLLIKSGVLRDENPLDRSPVFEEFLLACRRGDLRMCQEFISRGVNINGRDRFDYTPLIIASLCGHYELVELLLESGALAERNTFQGERCIYNALNKRIRNLLLQYDFSKSSDPYVYWSSHISTLRSRSTAQTLDITLDAGSRRFALHKFLLYSRSPYFRRKLDAQPEMTTWKLSPGNPVEAVQIAVRYIYLGAVPRDLAPWGSIPSEEVIAKGLDQIGKQLDMRQLRDARMDGSDRRLARQRHQDEVARAVRQIGEFFQTKVLGHKMVVDTDRVDEVRWKHDNSVFADVLLRTDEAPQGEDDAANIASPTTANGHNDQGIPIGPAHTINGAEKSRKSVLYPVHKAMLTRSDYFDKMFSGDFAESQQSEHLHIITVDCTPPVLEIILSFLYTENVICPLEHALDLLYMADMLFLDSLKNKAAIAISTLGSATNSVLVDRTHAAAAASGDDGGDAAVEVEPINIYDVVHAAWDLRVRRLEAFAARYLAYRLEDYIDEPEFHELIQESAQRIHKREETDTIELLDDIRYYLSERFRLRFEDAGLEEMMGNNSEMKDNRGKRNPEDAGSEDDAVLTLDGKTAEDEFASDAINYNALLCKIDSMLESLMLDA